MSRLSRLAPRDLDALSGYADGALSATEKQALERRLEQDPELRHALKEIRATSALLRALPQVRPPHNFTLTPEMAGLRSGWPRAPFLQLATAIATLALVITVGIDVFGVPMPSAALRAAAPAQEMAMEPPAEVAADALGAGAAAVVTGGIVVTEAVEVAETAVVAAAPLEMAAATPTMAPPPAEYANREAPTVAGAAVLPPAPAQEVATEATPPLTAVPTSQRECEACGLDQQLPTPAPEDKVAVTAVAQEPSVTQEVAVPVSPPLEAQPAPEARAAGGLPAVRWIEIGLGATALFLGVFTLRARRRGR